jgi:hypothetical protein
MIDDAPPLVKKDESAHLQTRHATTASPARLKPLNLSLMIPGKWL